MFERNLISFHNALFFQIMLQCLLLELSVNKQTNGPRYKQKYQLYYNRIQKLKFFV